MTATHPFTMFTTNPTTAIANTVRRLVASWYCPDSYCPIEETSRSADARSPVNQGYDLGNVLHEVLGRESATCEACQETVRVAAGGDLTDGDPFVIRRLVENVYTVENTVLLCHTCSNRPQTEWQTAVRRKRARERDEYPHVHAYAQYWLHHPTARTLFGRRVVAGIGLAVGLVVSVATLAGTAGAFLVNSRTGWAIGQLVVTTAGQLVAGLAGSPWVVGALLSLGYTAHAIERGRHDPRGAHLRDRPQWIPLVIAGGSALVGAVSILATTVTLLPASTWLRSISGLVWLGGAGGVAWYIDLALRDDRHRGRWLPSRTPWLVAGRLGFLPGFLALTVGVPFAGMVSSYTSGILAVIPAAVALTYGGCRLPYDPSARDTILDALPERVRTALTDDQFRE